jgi:superfamily I DNA/RNA helicase/mRNA-degrading endonuclease RelE of RelBE toxin-antitoxin system
MSFEIAFTKGFRDQVRTLPPEYYGAIDRQLKWLAKDPYARNLNAKRLKNVRQTFRMRIGKDVRMLYRIDGSQPRVVLFAVGQRASIYGHLEDPDLPLSGPDNEAIRAHITEPVRRLPKPSRTSPATPSVSEQQEIVQPHLEEQEIEVEQLPWLDEHELFLLHVPSDLWETILGAGSLDGLHAAAIPPEVKAQLEDYWTNPAGTHVDKLFSLANNQNLSSINQQPLVNFLVALDPEQREVLGKLKADGPYLLKGSAGTGKSLVGLYHVRDLVTARVGEGLYDERPSRYAVITFTNTLVKASEKLLHAITPESAHANITCRTLDILAHEIAGEASGKGQGSLREQDMANWIVQLIVPTLSKEAASLVTTLGKDYVVDEIEQAIYGNGLDSESEYLALDRQGRKRPLQPDERGSLWKVHIALGSLMQARGKQSFAQVRSRALEYLKNHTEYPRFAGVFVDEAQDFSKVARQLCLELVRDPRHLVLAADTGQSIYTVPTSWSQCDPRFDFRRRRPLLLTRSYRATKEIGRAIAPLRHDPGDEDDRSASASPVFSGPMPRWIEAPRKEHLRVVCEEIAGLLNAGAQSVHPSQIAIIVPDKSRANAFQAELKAQDIAAVLINKDTPIQYNGKSVQIVTAHSCKGLGFPVVLVTDVDGARYPADWRLRLAKDDKQREQIVDREQRLLYVALSRASHRLIMVTGSEDPSPFLAKLDRKAHWSD